MRFLQRRMVWLLSAWALLSGTGLAEDKAPDGRERLIEIRSQLIEQFNQYELTGDPAYDYAELVSGLNVQVSKMYRWMLEHGSDPRLVDLAEEHAPGLEARLERLRKWQSRNPKPRPQESDETVLQGFETVRTGLRQRQEELGTSDDPNVVFAKTMVWHHEAVYALSEALLKYSDDALLMMLANDISQVNSRNVAHYTNWLEEQ